MYQEYFGLKTMPFESTSNGSVFVPLPNHHEALNTLLFGLRSGEGLLKVVGEVGTGKTSLCRHLLTQLTDEERVVYLPSPSLEPLELMRAIADELEISVPSYAGMQLIQKLIREVLIRVATEGGRVIVFVDEAQTVPSASLEELRLLSNLESNQGKLVQVVLFGQPELDEKLARFELRQLHQRIAYSARLLPLDARMTQAYINRRLASAGLRGPSPFETAALSRIHRASGGIPRLINILSHKSLLAAYSDQAFAVGRRHVARALLDTEGIRRWSTRRLINRKSYSPFDRSLRDRLSPWRNRADLE